ncbi:MAG: hypothetical protein ACE5HA_03355 [Anaerolineae bacterium]
MKILQRSARPLNEVAVHQFATPTARDARYTKGDQTSNQDRNLAREVGGELNPTWVEWLMGFPIGWTDYAASATPSFRRWLRALGTPWVPAPKRY